MALSLICNTDDINQRDRVVLKIENKNRVLYLKLRWHVKIERWMLSIFDEDNNPVLRNIPLLAGFDYPSADLLRQFEYLEIGHAAVFSFTQEPNTPNPVADNLGAYKVWGLVWGLPDE